MVVVRVQMRCEVLLRYDCSHKLNTLLGLSRENHISRAASITAADNYGTVSRRAARISNEIRAAAIEA
jgi:hypothetical protein